MDFVLRLTVFHMSVCSASSAVGTTQNQKTLLMQLDCCFVFHIENIFLNVTRFSTTAQNVGAPYQVGVWCRHVGCVDGRKVNNTGRITSGNMKFILTKFF